MRASDDAGTRFHRAVWRWHSYAGLIVLPFLAWMAVTGALYLYKPEIERLLYRPLIEIAPGGAPLPAARLVAAVERASGGHVTQLIRPASAAESWRMTVAGGARGARTAFIDPYRGQLLGTTRAGGAMKVVRDLHSLIITGPVGNALVEIAAGWAILLVLSGVYLWWPSRAGNRALALRGPPRRRLFWRDLHASIGVVAGVVILFLAITGMPWTGVFGAFIQKEVAAYGLGRPAPPGAAMPHHDAAASLPWSLQQRAMPMANQSGDVGIDRVMSIAAARGLHAPWTLTRPASPGAPYLVSATAVAASDARVLYLDPPTGRILLDARYADFGSGARAIEWGIATHQGQQYGEPNRLVMLVGCIALLLLAVSAPLMWWKRRAPRGSRPVPGTGKVALLFLGVGLLFPLTGLTVAAAMGFDLLPRRA